MKNVKQMVKKSIVPLFLVLVAIQLVPIDRTNPPVESEVPAPPEVRAILRRSCYDCHSNETVWPWYSRVAPISWLVASDVHEGRGEMNFSTWDRRGKDDQAKLLHECWEQIEQGDMPPAIYLQAHPLARFSDSDRLKMRNWLQTSLPIIIPERPQK